VIRVWAVVALFAVATAVLWLIAPPAAVCLLGLALILLYLLGARGGATHRNPVDAGGLWYREQPFWRRLLVALLFMPVVIGWWLAYQLRRGWYGPAD
jgi:hypothetical protein